MLRKVVQYFFRDSFSNAANAAPIVISLAKRKQMPGFWPNSGANFFSKSYGRGDSKMVLKIVHTVKFILLPKISEYSQGGAAVEN